MFLSAKTYKEQLINLFRNASKIDVAVAFWGKGSDQLFGDGISAPRIICNLMTGASDPKVIQFLSKKFPDRVRHLSELHSKVVISDKSMIIGSANFSSSGLTTNPDGQNGWEEAGALIEDEKQIDTAQSWFEEIWSRASPILPRDIEIATIIWNRNRENRPVLSLERKLLDIPIDEFEDRPIYVAIWENYPCDAAAGRFDEVKPEIIKHFYAGGGTEVDFFQDATNYPPQAILISAQLLPTGRIKIEGAWIRVPEFDQELYGEEVGTIQIVVKRKRILDRLFDATTQKELAKVVTKYVDSVRDTNNLEYNSGVVRLFRILQFRTDV